MSDQSQEIAGLHVTVRLLTERIEQLEQVVSRLAPEPVAPTEPVAPPEPPRAEPWASRPAPAPPATPAPEEPQAEAWADLPALQPPPPPRPPSPPFDWGKLAEQLFAARTLAWAGGVATALGIVLLFVMAASRGWITPVDARRPRRARLARPARRRDRARPPHVALGRDPGRRRRRDRRPLREPLGRDVALPPGRLRGGRAARRARSPRSPCAVAIRIKQEPLALFGMSAAMLAPLLVSHDVTTGGVLFGAVMVGGVAPAPRPLRLAPPRDVGVGDRLRRDAGAARALLAAHRLRRPGHRRGRHGGALRDAHVPPGAPPADRAPPDACSAR